MSSHGDPDSVSARLSDPDRTEVAFIRRANGRTLRKSCDRCHQQKLQCIGDKASLTRCKRCQRAGLECVYGARSSKKAIQGNMNISETWDNGPFNFGIPTLNDPVSELDTVLGLQLPQLNNFLPLSPSSWPQTSDDASSVTYKFPRLEDSSRTFVSSAISPPLSLSSSSEAGEGPVTERPDLSADFANAFQKLEETFVITMKDQTSRETQDCMIQIPILHRTPHIISADSHVQTPSAKS